MEITEQENMKRLLEPLHQKIKSGAILKMTVKEVDKLIDEIIARNKIELGKRKRMGVFLTLKYIIYTLKDKENKMELVGISNDFKLFGMLKDDRERQIKHINKKIIKKASKHILITVIILLACFLLVTTIIVFKLWVWKAK